MSDPKKTSWRHLGASPGAAGAPKSGTPEAEEGDRAPADEPDAGRIDIAEHGRAEDGRPLSLNRRLFVQLLAYGKCDDTRRLVYALESADVPGVLYEDVNDPKGAALLTFSEDPSFFVGELRRFINSSPFGGLEPKPELTMLGRTYAMGHEPDLEEVLLTRPRRRLCNPAFAWAVWYPLRRAGSFERLSPEEQRSILLEHGGVGHAFGKAGYGFDVRLACHGLDKNDNDFVIGLIGPDLHPLSVIVERMRKTRQTSLHVEQLGPFFIGRVAWQTKRVRVDENDS